MNMNIHIHTMNKILFITCDANINNMKNLYKLPPLFPEIMKSYPNLLHIRFYVNDGGKKMSLLIDPEKTGVNFSYNSIKYHGINYNSFEKYGHKSEIILNEFLKVLTNINYIVCYDSGYTLGTLISEYYKMGFNVSKIFNNKKYLCLMDSSKKICKMNDFKSPKLEDIIKNTIKENIIKITSSNKLDYIIKCFEYLSLNKEYKLFFKNIKVYM